MTETWYPPLVSVGFDVQIHKSVIIHDFCQISDGTIIDEGCEVGAFVRTGKNCKIGKNVMVKAQSIICEDTIVEDNVFIGGGVMFLSEDVDGEHLITVVEQGAFIGARAVIATGVRIGRGAIVGAMAYVNKDVPPFSTVVGIPAKEIER